MNALDWLVGGPEFYEKPVAFFNASGCGVHAQAALREIVKTLSGHIIIVNYSFNDARRIMRKYVPRTQQSFKRYASSRKNNG